MFKRLSIILIAVFMLATLAQPLMVEAADGNVGTQAIANEGQENGCYAVFSNELLEGDPDGYTVGQTTVVRYLSPLHGYAEAVWDFTVGMWLIEPSDETGNRYYDYHIRIIDPYTHDEHLVEVVDTETFLIIYDTEDHNNNAYVSSFSYLGEHEQNLELTITGGVVCETDPWQISQNGGSSAGGA